MRSYTHRVDYDLTGRRALSLAQELATIPLAELDALILTLDTVNAIDASGLAVIVRLYSHLSRSRKFLVLKGFKPEVESLFRRVGLESVLVDADQPSALDDSKRHKPWTPADSRLPSRSQRDERPAVAKGDMSIDDVVDALARLDSTQAMSFLSKVQNRLGLTPAEPLPAVPSGLTDRSLDVKPSGPSSAEAPGRSFVRQGHTSQQFSVVQGEILRTGKRRKVTIDDQGICEPARSHSGEHATVEPDTAVEAAEPVPSESLPKDVENLLLDYLGHDPARRRKRRAAQAAPPSPTPGGAPGLVNPSGTEPGRPVRATPPPSVAAPPAEPGGERKRREQLPAGVRAILSDYLSHEDSTTLGPWASASGIG